MSSALTIKKSEVAIDLLQCVHKTLSRQHFNTTHGQTSQRLVLRAALASCPAVRSGNAAGLYCTKRGNVKLCSQHAGWPRSLTECVILTLQLDSDAMEGADAMQLEPLIIPVTNRESLKGSRRNSLVLP